MAASARPSEADISSGAAPDARTPRMPPRVRKVVTVVHVISSVGWLGLTLCLLTLGTTALVSDDPVLVRSIYRAMKVLGDVLIIPVTLTALLTGLLLALGTRWGLFRHYWVITKFGLTLLAAAASIFELRARFHEAASLVAQHPTGPVSAMHMGALRATLVVAPTVALCVYVANVTLSIFKPWGRRA
ncbi:MAG: hypothetical protein ACJ72W_17620 [Actinoallomurus sp.]